MSSSVTKIVRDNHKLLIFISFTCKSNRIFKFYEQKKLNVTVNTSSIKHRINELFVLLLPWAWPVLVLLFQQELVLIVPHHLLNSLPVKSTWIYLIRNNRHQNAQLLKSFNTKKKQIPLACNFFSIVWNFVLKTTLRALSLATPPPHMILVHDVLNIWQIKKCVV